MVAAWLKAVKRENGFRPRETPRGARTRVLAGKGLKLF